MVHFFEVSLWDWLTLSYVNQCPFLISGVRNLPKIEKKGSKPGSRKLSKDGGASGGAAAGAGAASEDTEVKSHWRFEF